MWIGRETDREKEREEHQGQAEGGGEEKKKEKIRKRYNLNEVQCRKRSKRHISSNDILWQVIQGFKNF